MEARKPIITDINSGIAMTTPEPNVRHVSVLLSPFIQTGLEDFAVGYTAVPTGQQGSKHRHPDGAEVWLFFGGTGSALVGEEEIELEPGTVVYTPPNTYHHLFNTGDQPLEVYYIFVPSGEEQKVIMGGFR